MKTATKPSTILKYRGKLCEIVAIATSKVLFIREIGAKRCERCGEIKEYVEVESSLNFQEQAEPVITLSSL